MTLAQRYHEQCLNRYINTRCGDEPIREKPNETKTKPKPGNPDLDWCYKIPSEENLSDSRFIPEANGGFKN
jgi:hypothetical protein